ncbi:hypothetical protein JTB14_021168 [Gonioctena quinquepunctata]|nr:hypothetical protein JTB14_021168 [Gonioctena quinquepunctata]
MSKESLRLIKSMLRVDPKKRITIQELLSHPWLTLGILEPVELRSENVKCYDAQCVELMASHNQVPKEMMWDHLKKWKYDYHTATYLLMISKKSRGSSLKLNSTAAVIPVESNTELPLTRKTILKKIANAAPTIVIDEEKELKSFKNNYTPSTPIEKNNSHRFFADGTPVTHKTDRTSDFLEPNKPSSTRKALKRVRSPCPDDCSPVPTKRVPLEPSTPVHTPDRGISSNTTETPGSARRVLGSIERSFHRVVNVLTPRRNDDAVNVKPMLLTGKHLCNVSTTQYRDPEFVINELSKALEKKGVVCKRKG